MTVTCTLAKVTPPPFSCSDYIPEVAMFLFLSAPPPLLITGSDVH